MTGVQTCALPISIIDLGRHLDLDVVAEGVEDQETWDMLAEMGCHIVQGWHLGRPMAPDALVPWLHERESRRPPSPVLRLA